MLARLSTGPILDSVLGGIEQRDSALYGLLRRAQLAHLEKILPERLAAPDHQRRILPPLGQRHELLRKSSRLLQLAAYAMKDLPSPQHDG